MARLTALVLGLLAAGSLARDDDADAGALQSAEMMADVMPHDDAPKPTKEMQDKIDKAGPMVFSAYQSIKDAEDSVDAATQQMRAGIKTASAGGNIASAESLIQRATSKLEEGKKLATQAKSDFMKS